MHRPGDPIRWRLHLAAPPEVVFEALDSAEGRRGFWAESAEEADGRIHFIFANGVREEARVLERRPPRLLELDYFGSPVRFELSPDGDGGTELLLVHKGVAEDEWHEVHAGWLNVLFPLKARVDHDVELRNRDPARSWHEGYADG